MVELSSPQRQLLEQVATDPDHSLRTGTSPDSDVRALVVAGYLEHAGTIMGDSNKKVWAITVTGILASLALNERQHSTAI